MRAPCTRALTCTRRRAYVRVRTCVPVRVGARGGAVPESIHTYSGGGGGRLGRKVPLEGQKRGF